MAPLWSGHARLEYTHRFSDRDVLRVTGGLKYSDKYIVNDILPQPDYLKIDAGVALDHGPVTFSVVGRTLGNHPDCGGAPPTTPDRQSVVSGYRVYVRVD